MQITIKASSDNEDVYTICEERHKAHVQSTSIKSSVWCAHSHQVAW